MSFLTEVQLHLPQYLANRSFLEYSGSLNSCEKLEKFNGHISKGPILAPYAPILRIQFFSMRNNLHHFWVFKVLYLMQNYKKSYNRLLWILFTPCDCKIFWNGTFIFLNFRLTRDFDKYKYTVICNITWVISFM